MRAGRRQLQLTQRDRKLLGFVADHRFVLAAHVQVLLATSSGGASARLRALSRAGLLKPQTVFHRQPACYRITQAGLDAVGSELPAPALHLNCYMHDVGAAWMWLTARAGGFGPVTEIVSERQMRSRDARARHADLERERPPYAIPAQTELPLAVRLGGVGPQGQPRLHYPDLLLRTENGCSIAVELELSGKDRGRRETILAGYASDPRIDGVVYLANHTAVRGAVEATARRLGISSLVHVGRFAWSPSMRTLDDTVSGRTRTARTAASSEHRAPDRAAEAAG